MTPLSHDPSAKGARCAFGNPPTKDQADFLRASQVDIFPDHLFEQAPTGQRTVKYLSTGKLCLQDGQIIMNRGHEIPAHRRHRRRRGYPRPSVPLEEGRYATAGLESWLIGIEIQSVYPFHVQHNLVFQQLPQRLFYHCHWPRLAFGLNVPPPLVQL